AVLGIAVGQWPVAFALALGLMAATGCWLLVRQQARLARREGRFRDFAEVGSHWFWEMGPDLRVTWVSGSIRPLTRVAPEWDSGKRRQQLDAGRHGQDPAWAEHLDRLERRLPFDGFVYELLGPDGNRQWTRTSGTPLFDTDGGFLGYRGASTLCTKEM